MRFFLEHCSEKSTEKLVLNLFSSGSGSGPKSSGFGTLVNHYADTVNTVRDAELQTTICNYADTIGWVDLGLSLLS
jgi:hypothetical protein